MISILYPKDDYTSADIAIKIQALAQNQPGTIFIVPKHFGRNDINVQKNLLGSSSAMLLLHDKRSLDVDTKKEIELLVKNKKKVFCIAPKQSKPYLKLPPVITPHFFDPSKPGDFLATVQRISGELKDQKDKGGDFGMFLIMLALIMLIISSFNDDKKK
jgi:hypothetical protein